MSYVLTSLSGNLISAASAGYAPTNSAEVSAIASAYATGAEQVVTAVGTETAYTPDGVSDVVTSINGYYISALSADSAFQASYDENGRELTSLASEYEASSIASSYAESAVSSKADSSALSSYALSADVSGTVDLVSTQSANWGGSALALSAGPGVKLEKVGNTLVASQDRTLLWSGDMTTGGTRLVNLSESLTNFESLGFWHSFEGAGVSKPQWAVLSAGFAMTTGTSRVIGTIGPAMSLKPWENNDIYQAFGNYVSPSSATNNDQIYLRGAKVLLNGGVQDFGSMYHCYAIYGINRTAEA